MSQTALRALIDRVVVDPELWPGLLAVNDRADFVQRVCGLADGWGLEVSPDDVETALIQRRREWFERWV